MATHQNLRLVWLRIKPPLTISFLAAIFFIFCIEIYIMETKDLDKMKKELHYVSLAYVSFWVVFLILVNELNNAAERRNPIDKKTKTEIKYQYKSPDLQLNA